MRYALCVGQDKICVCYAMHARPCVRAQGQMAVPKPTTTESPISSFPSYEVLPDDSYLFIPGISGPLLLPSVMSGCWCWVNTEAERQGKKKRDRNLNRFFFSGFSSYGGADAVRDKAIPRMLESSR